MITGFDRKGNIWQISDTVSLIHSYERLEKVNFSAIWGVIKTCPSYLLNGLFSEDAGRTWNVIIFDYDCPLQQNWQYTLGITRKGQTLYSEDKGYTWTFYESPRANKYFQFKWILAIPKSFTINNTKTSFDYGATWIDTSTIKNVFLSAFGGSISAQITRSEIKKAVKEEELPPEEIFTVMLEYLPRYERNSKFFKEILLSHAKEIYKLINLLGDLQKQLFASTATWGLDIWEEFLNIPRQNLSDEERRALIIHKLVSNVFASLKNVEDLATHIAGKEVRIVEDFRKQVVIVKDYFGDILPDALYLYTRIREIIPAHLGIVFEYRMWDWLEKKFLWDEFEEKQLTWDKYEEVDEEWLNIHRD